MSVRKNFLKRIKGIVFALMYIVIYYVVSAATQFAYVLWRSLSEGASLSQIENGVRNGLYALSVISTIFTLWVYLFIGKIRNKRIGNVLENKKVPLMVSIMAAMLAIGMRLIVTVYYSYSQNVELLKKSIDEAAVLSPQLTNTVQLLIALFSIVVIAPFFEEILFRGLVMDELMSAVRPWVAITLQAILFGAAHTVLFQSIFAVLVGVILGIVYYVTKSIKTSVICHGVFNFSVILTGSELTLMSGTVITLLGILLSVCSLFYIIANCRKNS